MTDYEKSIRDLDSIAKQYRNVKGVSGAVPMPLRTVNNAFQALTLEDTLMTMLDGFEVDDHRAMQRLEHCMDSVDKQCTLSDLDHDTLSVAFGIMKQLIESYYLRKCSLRHHNGNKRNR